MLERLALLMANTRRTTSRGGRRWAEECSRAGHRVSSLNVNAATGRVCASTAIAACIREDTHLGQQLALGRVTGTGVGVDCERVSRRDNGGEAYSVRACREPCWCGRQWRTRGGQGKRARERQQGADWQIRRERDGSGGTLQAIRITRSRAVRALRSRRALSRSRHANRPIARLGRPAA